MESIVFEQTEFPLVRVEMPFGETFISTESLNNNLMNSDGSYVSEMARIIDEKIFYFVADENISLRKEELVKLILSEI